ncbi:MmgE/PrpD family protein [Variovorax sp. PBL-E5]|uniref:MmgE/PrpD family protein n=1 Tax=Variovorax sp. PBL-E5 TaxID=434014 RepID=UPI0013180CBF|nr:MmgE/PrpD family protein [Variovorax sp. PBL-E5]VTU19743.1 MmgE/PrpD family protein [Variovorax sp. PBL-E5]
MASSFFSDFADFAAQAATTGFPALAQQRALDGITDCVGCIAAGRREPLAGKLLRALPGRAFEGSIDAETAVMAFSDRAALPTDAAIFNGALAHAIDFDDSSHPAYAHTSAVLVPTLLSASAMARVSGTDAINAYIVGLEMFGKLARGMNNRHYENGWHATSTFGTIAAAAAAAMLLRLPAAQIAGALNLATSFASGLRAHFGTMTKPLHAGIAARNGIQAAMLAREDFGCASAALDHPYGFATVFNWGPDKADLGAMGKPGEALEILTDYGLSLKAFPSCGATHPGIEAATKVHRWLAGRKPRRVRIGVPELSFRPLIHHSPKTPLEGKFSLEFCVAAGLLDGQVRIDTFTQARVSSPDIVGLIARTTMEVDERVRFDPEWATAVRVETEDGAMHEELVPLAIGKVGRWFSENELRTKFLDCCRGVLADDRADGLFRTLRDLPSLDSLATLQRQLHVASRQAEARDTASVAA